MLARLAILFLELYQRTLSRLLGPRCRFEPSCSRYASACIANHGLLRGGLLSFLRMCKCHPFHPGGYDPPPRLAGDAQHASKRRGRSSAAAAQPRAAD